MGEGLRKDGNPRSPRIPMPEMELRVAELAAWMCEARPRSFGQIKRWGAEKWGLKPRSITLYVSRARALLCAYAEEPLPIMVAKSKAVYDKVINDPMSTPRDIIRAQSKQDLLLGLCRPQRIEVQASVVTAQTTLQALPWADMARQVASMHDMQLPQAPEPIHSLTDVHVEEMPAIGPITDIDTVKTVAVPFVEPETKHDEDMPKSI